MFARKRFTLVLWLISGVILLSSCERVTEREQLQLVRESESAQDRIGIAREFLTRFPESRDRGEVFRLLFQSAVEMEDGPVAEEAAHAYLETVSEKRRDALRSSLARTLAEHGIALEFAVSLARDAVEHARSEGVGSLARYLDSLAYVLYRDQKLEEAEKFQTEAVGLQPERGDLLGQLALYQFESGKPLQALETGSRAILLGDEEYAYQHLPRWALSEGPEMAEQATMPLIDDFLRERDVPERKARAALLLALAGIHLDRAETLAHSAISQMKIQSPDAGDEISNAEVCLAQVYVAQGRYTAAINTLASRESERSPWDPAFWFTMGRAYRLSEQPEEARNALVQPLLVGDSDLIRSELHALGMTDEDIQRVTKEEKDQLESFDPGSFTGRVPDSGRITLVELFTGAECNPCQSADLAMDLIAGYFPRQAVAILEHHVHIPQPDPLTTGATELRYQFDGAGGTPTVWVDGRERISGGGPPILKKSMFRKYSEAIESRWTVPPLLTLELSASRVNDLVSISVDADAGGRSSSVSGTVRIALVEKEVDYEGGNGIRQHAFVVRHLSDPGAPTAQLENGKAKVEYQIDLVQLERDLRKYLDDFEANPPERYQGFAGFRSKPIQLNRSNLSVVAWVENRETREILQTAFTDF